MQLLRDISTCGASAGVFARPRPQPDMSGPLLLRCTASTCYTPHGPWAWGHRDAAARVHWLARRRRRLAFCIGRTKRRTGGRTMRAIGLVLLSIAIMAFLLTDPGAKRRRSRAQ